jgi:hypothetical protein
MSELQSKFQCPACKSPLATDRCPKCGKRYATEDGILDFVGGRFDTRLDIESYDEYHGIGDTSAGTGYRQLKELAANPWPSSLGSGLRHRSLLARDDRQQ